VGPTGPIPDDDGTKFVTGKNGFGETDCPPFYEKDPTLCGEVPGGGCGYGGPVDGPHDLLYVVAPWLFFGFKASDGKTYRIVQTFKIRVEWLNTDGSGGSGTPSGDGSGGAGHYSDNKGNAGYASQHSKSGVGVGSTDSPSIQAGAGQQFTSVKYGLPANGSAVAQWWIVKTFRTWVYCVEDNKYVACWEWQSITHWRGPPPGSTTMTTGGHSFHSM